MTVTNISVPTVNDNIDEPNETFTLAIIGSQGGPTANITDTGTATITDDDSAPDITIRDDDATEGTDTALIFDISLSNPSSEAITLTLQTINGTAFISDDYEGQIYTATFAAGHHGWLGWSVADAVPVLVRCAFGHADGAGSGADAAIRDAFRAWFRGGVD